MQEFIKLGNLILGICNGFQVLVKCNLLPDLEKRIDNEEDITYQQATLIHNDRGLFENRWVHLKINPSNLSPWLKNIDNIYLPIRHGEGKFYAPGRK